MNGAGSRKKFRSDFNARRSPSRVAIGLVCSGSEILCSLKRSRRLSLDAPLVSIESPASRFYGIDED